MKPGVHACLPTLYTVKRENATPLMKDTQKSAVHEFTCRPTGLEYNGVGEACSAYIIMRLDFYRSAN